MEVGMKPVISAIGVLVFRGSSTFGHSEPIQQQSRVGLNARRASPPRRSDGGGKAGGGAMSRPPLMAPLAAAGLLLAHTGPAWATAESRVSPPSAPQPIYLAKADAPASGLQSELQGVTERMKALLGEGKRVAARLENQINDHPQEADKLIRDTATTLSGMADQTTSTGDVIKEVAAIRAKALAYRQTVMSMPAGVMSETDRQRVLEAWNRVIDTASKAQAAVADIHVTLLAELQELRRREVAVGQLMLAGEYQAALDDVITWTTELKATIEKLNNLLTGQPSS
jgi:hypothetical protein